VQRKTHFETSVVFDDPDLIRFFRSMPYPRRDVAIRVIGRAYLVHVGLLLVPMFSVFGYVGHLLGAEFGAESTGSMIGFFVGGCTTGCSLSLYRNRKLREFINAGSRDSLLLNWPACRKPQALDTQLTCVCGCIMRPFTVTTK
jgi:hypothetical protein